MYQRVCRTCNTIISSFNQSSQNLSRSRFSNHVLVSLTSCLRIIISLAAAIGSVPEVPAESCNEVKTSEKGRDGKYWLSSIIPGTPLFASCYMKTEG